MGIDQTDSGRWVLTRSMLPARSEAVVAVIAAGLLVANLRLGLVVEDETFAVRPATYVLSIAGALILAWRIILPIPTLVAVAAIVATYLLSDNPPSPIIVTVLIALYTVASRRDRRTVAIVVATLAVLVAVVGLNAEQREPTTVERLSIASFVVFPVVLGDAVRSRRAVVKEAAERVRATEAAALAHVEREVQAERLRIARDLHDVVAHSISAVNVQAGAAELVVEHDPGAAMTALREIRVISKSALNELRVTLHVLRDDGTTPAEPVAGLDDIARLIDQHPDATLVTKGTPGFVDPAVAVHVYRIVQESLTNTVKHAAGQHVDVTIEYGPTMLHLEVHNAASDTQASEQGDRVGTLVADGTSGFGLVGMRERVQSVGGEFDARRRLDGGFEVVATLPRQPTQPVTDWSIT